MTQDVEPQAIKQAGDGWREVHDEAAAAVTRLAGVLKGSAGMAGTDNGAHAWASKYDPLCGGRDGASGVMESASVAVIAAGQVSDLLHATAVNHANGDQQSAINSPNAPAVPPASVPVFLEPEIPSAEGGHGDVPGWWHTIQAYVQGEVWPNGHQAQLHDAAQAWRNAAAGLRAAAFLANSATLYVARQKSPEIPAIVANCNKARDALNSAADGCDVAAKCCDDYASAIDDAHHKIIHEMEVLGATVAVTEVVAAVLVPFTAGASEGVSKIVDVSRLTATGARIAEIIRAFRAAAEMSAMPAVSAAGAAARSISELGPLLRARPTIFAAETAGRGGAGGIEGAEAARLSQESVMDKLERYLLNPDHEAGGPKANWFEQALGFNRQNAPDLARQIVFDESKAVETGVTQYGTKFNQVIPITGANGKTIDVTFAWIRNNDGVVRLVTAIPTSR
ncbi:DUF6883 domain-containing protein [Mycobacterium kyorinense]|uniref:DUF6883 domain-containing protein n=1 Tax=Mycobacterium kyorinense TaxID=487514 RepID=UPI000B2F8D08|nr:DUF6883 domain-containing protein [Mycobacterium kyorinense]